MIGVLTLLALLGRAHAEPTELPLQDGDIVLHKSRSAQSTALRAATGSPYTHVGLAFTRDGTVQILEAVQPVRWTPLADWVARGHSAHVVVVRAEEPLTEHDVATLRRSAEGHLGRDYDLLFRWDDARIYCSELVYKAYAAIGRPVGDLVPLGSFDLTSDAVQQLVRTRTRASLDLSEPVVAPASMLDHAGFRIVHSTDPSVPAH
ncbi:MAG: peptidase [Myxococcales bacterium]|nr:peptidase [Myxococcales bacterium]